MRIVVFGQGLQSRVTSALLASVGNQVFIDQLSFDKALCGASQREPDLVRLYQEQITAGRIQALEKNSNLNMGLSNESERLDFVILAEILPNRILEKYKATIEILINNKGSIIILTPAEIGEAETFSQMLSLNGKVANVCSVPLLLREGRAITDFSRPESIIVGCDNNEAFTGIEALFHPFNRVKNVIKRVSSREAEFSCFAGHAMLATRLSFMNEMASLAERSNVDIEVIRECIGMDPRIGKDYLYPGCGFGGQALASNLEKVASQLRQRNDDLGLLDVVVEINDRQKDLLFRKIWKFFNTDLSGKKVAIWGASFKPGSASISGAASIQLINSLLAHSVKVAVYDPMAGEQLLEKFYNNKNFTLASSAKEACQNSHVLAICTEWKEFWSPDLVMLASELTSKAIFDGRNILDSKTVANKGLRYFAIGRGERI